MNADAILIRLRPLGRHHRVAHLAALIRCEANLQAGADGSPRQLELARLLRAQSAAITASLSLKAGRAG